MASYLPTTEQSAHWYDRAGNPVYELPKKDGKGMKTPTLADARKLGLVPGITGVCKIVAKPGLERWKQEQLLLSALTTPRQEGESDKDFVRRIMDEAQKPSEEAADLGTEIHKGLEDYLRSGTYSVSHNAIEYFRPVVEKIERGDLVLPGASEGAMLEVSRSHPLGFGGKADYVMPPGPKWDDCVIDFKTQATKEGKDVAVYEDWAMQLAALAEMWGVRNGFNIVISTTEPGRVEVVDQTEKMDSALQAFLNALDLWEWVKGFDASFSPEKEAE